MKKLITVLAVLGGCAVIMSSCSKDYECACTENGQERYTYSLTEKSDKEAEEQCNLKATTLGAAFQCSIK